MRELETLVRHLADELAGFRRRALARRSATQGNRSARGRRGAISTSPIAVTQLGAGERAAARPSSRPRARAPSRCSIAFGFSDNRRREAGIDDDAKKHTLKVTILNEEYSIRSDTPPEHARAVAKYLDQAIRKVMSSGGVVETNRAVVLAALQITAELFEAKATIEARERVDRGAERVRSAAAASVEAHADLGWRPVPRHGSAWACRMSLLPFPLRSRTLAAVAKLTRRFKRAL